MAVAVVVGLWTASPCLRTAFLPPLVAALPQSVLALDSEQVPGTWSDAHRLLFTPRAAPPEAYVVKVLPSPMAVARPQVMQTLGVVGGLADGSQAAPDVSRKAAAPDAARKTADASHGAGGSWAVKRLEVAEAFGLSGSYEPVRLARLFNGRRVEVSRGPVVRDGRTIAAVTLISPYPDPTLSRIEPGTLVIVLRL